MKNSHFGGSSMKKLLLLIVIPVAFIMANSGVTVTQSSANLISLSVSLPTLQIGSQDMSGKTFSALAFPDAAIPTEIGAPQLPLIREFVEIPFGAQVSVNVEILKSEYINLPNQVMPFQPSIPKTGSKPAFVMNEDAYNQDQFITNFQNDSKTSVRASIAMIGEIRGHRVALVEIYPLAYNPKQNTVEYASEMRVNLVLTGSNIMLTEQMRNNFYSKPYDMMLQGMVMNYDAYVLNPPPDLPVGYLIIVPDAWVSNIQPLVQWRTRKGYKVFVRTLSQVGGGTNTTVRNYILNAYNTWTIKPTFVLLVGDIDKIGYWIGTGSDNPPTDLNYSMMTTPDYLPDLDLSRASVADAYQLDSLVQKTIKYEQNNWINGTDWTKKALFIASADGSNHGVAEGTMRYCMARMRRFGYGVICDSIFTYYTSGAAAIATTKINEGRAWVTFSGHGAESGWADPGITYSTTNIHALANVDKVPIVGSYCCLMGNFAYSSECGEEAWIRSGYRGAIANYASSVTSYWPNDDTLQRRVFDAALDSNFYWAMGMLNKGKLAYYLQWGDVSFTRRYFEEYNMLGDGAIDIYWDVPATLSVTYPSIIPLGTYTIPVSVMKLGSPVQNALVCAKIKSDTVFASAYTNALGQASLQITTNNPDSVYITVTGHNCAPHLGGTMALAANGPYMMYLRNQIYDPLPGGNNDGLINPGEAIEMQIWFKNLGSAVANNVRAWLRSTDPCVTITDSFKTLGNVAPNDSIYTPDGFNFTVAASCTNCYSLPFTLTLKDANDTTWTSALNLTVYQCKLASDSNIVNDPTPGGNNNHILDPGETVNIISTVGNIGGANADNVTAVLSTNNSHITITDPNSNFGTINTGSTGNNSSDPFAVTVDNSITSGSMVTFKVLVTSGVYIDSFEFTLPVGLYLEDFEATSGGYAPSPFTGGWAWGVPTSGPNSAHSGTKVWATVLGGNYANSANWTLTSPTLQASADNPTLKFWHWYYMESNYDGGNVKISTNGGLSWNLITPDGGYNGTAPSSNVGIPNQACYMGQSSSWSQVIFSSLPVTAGQQFLLRWCFGSDASVVYAGWYIDDITGIGLTNILSGISEGSQSVSRPITMLYAPKPNPVTNGIAHISYSIAEASKVTLRVYDASGRVVRTLVNGQAGPGIYNVVWNGQDENHQSVAKGIYFYTLETPKQNFTKKLIFTR
jgi:hypothetical protein